MRIPIPIAMLLSLAVVAGAWWYGSRDADFLTPPTDARLTEIKAKAQAAIPHSDSLETSTQAPPEAPKPAEPEVAAVVKPTLELGDLNRPPSLQEYADLAPKGTAYLIELSALLENEGQFQRALLAWERILELSKNDESQTKTAISAIKRLRPTLPDWNTDPAKKIPIILHAGTAKKNAKILAPILDQAAHSLESASSGILKITTNINVGKDVRNAKGPTPVAIWLTGPMKNPVSTEVLSFTSDSKDTLHDSLLHTVFSLIRTQLSRNKSSTIPPPPGEKEPPLDALGSHISRANWQDFGNTLNQPEKKAQ
ncbi:MAG: hypothetical protein H8M99_02495 [Gloeobacteraceae cyanobacterium ES-bin-144]|nr:hypothetical protein [Verrucomicrobiales bacterium]